MGSDHVPDSRFSAMPGLESGAAQPREQLGFTTLGIFFPIGSDLLIKFVAILENA
jgi:hypothetical protein